MNIDALKLANQHPGVDISSKITDGHIKHVDEYGNKKEANFLYSHVNKPSHQLLDDFKQKSIKEGYVTYNAMGYLSNKNLSKEHIHDVIDHLVSNSYAPKLSILHHTMSNPNHDSSHLNKIVGKDGTYRVTAFQHGNYSPEELHKEATTPSSDEFVSGAIALNKNTSKETLGVLKNSTFKSVRDSSDYMLKQRFGE